MSKGNLHVVRELFTALCKLLRYHIEDILKLTLRFLRCPANRVTTFDSGNISNITPVVVAPTNNLVVEQRLHETKSILKST